jgi:REP element-mobilizing transposase RayT
LQRPQFARTLPVHVTMRMARHVYNLRSRRAFAVVGAAIAKAAERLGMRIVHFSVQGNHLHLIVEATTTDALSTAMQGFSIRVARGLNAMMGRRGRVLADRFHAHVLRTPSETRRAVAYVRENFRRHMREIGKPVGPRSKRRERAERRAQHGEDAGAATSCLDALRVWTRSPVRERSG